MNGLDISMTPLPAYNCLYGALCYGGCVMNNHKCRKDDFVELLPVIVEDKITEYYKRAAL